MILSIVVSRSGAKDSRINTDSGLEEVLTLLMHLGVADWNLHDKGVVTIESNGLDLFVAVGPLMSVDNMAFLAQAVACLRQEE